MCSLKATSCWTIGKSTAALFKRFRFKCINYLLPLVTSANTCTRRDAWRNILPRSRSINLPRSAVSTGVFNNIITVNSAHFRGIDRPVSIWGCTVCSAVWWSHDGLHRSKSLKVCTEVILMSDRVGTYVQPEQICLQRVALLKQQVRCWALITTDRISMTVNAISNSFIDYTMIIHICNGMEYLNDCMWMTRYIWLLLGLHTHMTYTCQV